VSRRSLTGHFRNTGNGKQASSGVSPRFSCMGA
jgi:hypothetical protein